MTRGAVALLLAPALLPLAAGPAEAADPDPNPTIEESCGLDLTLVLDASGSVESSHAVGDVRDAAKTLLEALGNTNSTGVMSQFASLSQGLVPQRSQIDTQSLESDGIFGEAVADYYNPIPPRPNDVDIYSYQGGSVSSAGSFNRSNGSNQYTNWDAALREFSADPGELVVFITDGDPTGYDLDQGSDPFDAGPPPDVAVNTNRSSGNQETIDRAVTEANALKATGARVLTIGVGSALNNSASVDRLEQVSGPQVVRDDDLGSVDSLNEIDVALVEDFERLSQVMRSLVLQLCSPSLTIRKLAQTSGDAGYAPEQGRDITVTPTVPGGNGFDWILPDTAPATSKTQATDVNGFAQFQWEPDPPEEDSTATVAEATDPDFTPGRPGASNDYRCEARNEDGDVRVVTGEFADPDDPTFELDPIEQEIVTCDLYNSYDYAPAVALEKSNAPPEVRGDLDPPAEVTSTYTVTNPGNTPLDVASLTDDTCAPVEPVPTTGPNTGDTNADGLLDVGEEWEYTCDRPEQASLTTGPPLNVVNTATVSATDPSGQVVTDDATAEVDVYTPGIEVTKLVNGNDDLATIQQGEDAAYRYEVANTGNTPLTPVDLSDDTDPCTAPTRGADVSGNNDDVLDVGETWLYTCTATPDQDVVNTATVTGTPVNPAQGNAAFPGDNPDVTDTDPATVRVVNPGLDLAKSVDPDLVLLDPGANPPDEPVTYTFTATNTGDDPLARPGGTSPTADGWIQDAQCTADAEYQSGDDGNDGIFGAGETWTFTCPGAVGATTVNVASITGLPADDAGAPLPNADPLTDRARALVRVRQPGIEVTKTAVRPTVLDPDADPFEGPDYPTPREAEYVYDVTNTGDVPLSLAGSPPADDTCAPLGLTTGDANGNDLLDPEETWEYTCATTLEREDSAVDPGAQSGLVENTVTVTGVPFFDGALVPGKAVTDRDVAQVLVIEPVLTLTKTASNDVVNSGDTVRYTFEATNDGDVDLAPAAITDDKCSPLTYTGGDTDGDGRIDGANSTPETWTWTCTRSVSPTPPETTDVNSARIVAVDPLGNGYEATDTAEVRVITPAIELTKTPRQLLVPAGTPVTYDFAVTNVGTSSIPAEDVLDDIRIADRSAPALPSCNNPVLDRKEGGNQDDLLDRDPAETWYYTCTAPIDDDTVNVAGVRGTGGEPVGLEFPVRDFAVARVGVFHPGIDVVKSASPSVVEGSGPVTYTYEVTNTGDVPLADVADRIEDDTCSPVSYVSGDADGDGLLDTPDSIFEDDADETWTFTCTTRVDERTTNTVLVDGSPSGPRGRPLCGPDALEVLVQEPCDVAARDTALVRVVEPTSPPTEPPGGTTPPGTVPPGTAPPATGVAPGTGATNVWFTGQPLPDTGAPPGLRELLLLGLVLLAAGAGSLVHDRRRRRHP